MRLINRRPGRPLAIALAMLPFAAVLLAYVIGSEMRLAVNPQDKLLPAPSTILDTAIRLISQGDRRTGRILFWHDTWDSLRRLGLGVGIAALSALVFGMAIGMLPHIRKALSGFVAVVSMVPPLAVLPILFIIFGLGELSKAVLIVFGIAPFIIRDVMLRVAEIPREQIVKAQTLGASTWQMILGVVLPQVLPRLVSSVRLSLGAAWLFVIAAEAITAEAGLGSRIFLVRRYLAMDVILPYVVWITFLAFAMDYALRMIHDSIPWTRFREGG